MKGQTLSLCLVSKAFSQPMVALEGLDITNHHPDTSMQKGRCWQGQNYLVGEGSFLAPLNCLPN